MGTPVDQIPAVTASDDELFKHLLAISEPSYFEEEGANTSFFVQAARELGYYGYDIRPFKKYLTIKTSKDYLKRLMLPEELGDMKFDKTLSRKIIHFLKNNDPKMIFIYGQNDPWTAAGVTWLKGKRIFMSLWNPTEVIWPVSALCLKRERRSHRIDKEVVGRVIPFLPFVDE